jgi:hypothetical protein
MSKRAVGIRLNVGPGLCTQECVGMFLKKASCELEGIGGVNTDVNPLVAKHYDYITGDIYFHFQLPIQKYLLEEVFGEDEIIPEL